MPVATSIGPQAGNEAHAQKPQQRPWRDSCRSRSVNAKGTPWPIRITPNIPT